MMSGHSEKDGATLTSQLLLTPAHSGPSLSRYPRYSTVLRSSGKDVKQPFIAFNTACLH